MKKMLIIATVAIATLTTRTCIASETILDLPLNGTTNFIDQSETKATANSTVGVVIKDDALIFKAPKTKFNYGTKDVFELGKEDMTFIAKIKLNPKQEKYTSIISKGAGGGTNAGYSLVYKTPGKALYLYVSDGQKRYTFASKTEVLNDNKWHTIAVSLSRSESVIFAVDGRIRGERAENKIPADNISNPNTPLYIGSWNGAWGMSGSMKDIKIIKEALDSEELLKITKL